MRGFNVLPPKEQISYKTLEELYEMACDNGGLENLIYEGGESIGVYLSYLKEFDEFENCKKPLNMSLLNEVKNEINYEDGRNYLFIFPLDNSPLPTINAVSLECSSSESFFDSSLLSSVILNEGNAICFINVFPRECGEMVKNLMGRREGRLDVREYHYNNIPLSMIGLKTGFCLFIPYGCSFTIRSERTTNLKQITLPPTTPFQLASLYSTGISDFKFSKEQIIEILIPKLQFSRETQLEWGNVIQLISRDLVKEKELLFSFSSKFGFSFENENWQSPQGTCSSCSTELLFFYSITTNSEFPKEYTITCLTCLSAQAFSLRDSSSQIIIVKRQQIVEAGEWISNLLRENSINEFGFRMAETSKTESLETFLERNLVEKEVNYMPEINPPPRTFSNLYSHVSPSKQIFKVSRPSPSSSKRVRAIEKSSSIDLLREFIEKLETLDAARFMNQFQNSQIQRKYTEIKTLLYSSELDQSQFTNQILSLESRCSYPPILSFIEGIKNQEEIQFNGSQIPLSNPIESQPVTQDIANSHEFTQKTLPLDFNV